MPRSSSLEIVRTSSLDKIDSLPRAASYDSTQETSRLQAPSDGAGSDDSLGLQGQKSSFPYNGHDLPEPRSVHFIDRGAGLVISLLNDGIR